MRTTGFRYLDHMADTIVEAYGRSLEEAFENSGRALVNIMFGLEEVIAKKTMRIDVQGRDIENLLYCWLEKILLLVLVDEFIPSEFDASIIMEKSSILLTAIARGEDINLRRHVYHIEVKAITYHEMSIEQEKDNFTIRYLVDL
jgi:SHS2 domain-containing protein